MVVGAHGGARLSCLGYRACSSARTTARKAWASNGQGDPAGPRGEAPDPVLVPVRPGPFRPGKSPPPAISTRSMPSGLPPGPPGDRPAVLARQVRQAAPVPRLSPGAGAPPARTGRYPAHQDLERLLPAGRVYAVTRGHRKIFSRHTPMISGGAASAAGSTSKITLYGWTS